MMLPEVIKYAKEYFECFEISGIRLENNGGDSSAGSHWESTILKEDVILY